MTTIREDQESEARNNTKYIIGHWGCMANLLLDRTKFYIAIYTSWHHQNIATVGITKAMRE